MSQEPAAGQNIVPFGKHKGKDVLELIEADPNYIQWLVGQDWFRDKYVTLHQTIINRGPESEETPEHNALQVMFLDDAFCLRFCHVVGGGREAFEQPMIGCLQMRRQEQEEFTVERVKETTRRLESTAKQLTRGPDDTWYRQEHSRLSAELHDLVSLRDQLAVPVTRIAVAFRPDFENNGIDVRLGVNATSVNHSSDLLAVHSTSIDIEIKPVVGDDYPAVLRQMRRNGSTVLFLKSYIGQGATREQFIATFATAGFHVVFLEQCT